MVHFDMYEREIKPELLKSTSQYPVVTVIGPRQSGKSTLVRDTFPDKPYVNLESPDIRRLAISDPRALFSQFPDGAILDEIQNVPELLSYIQVIVDERKQNGMFILTGSHQVSLHQAISQSLAGRTALLTLFPLSMAEIQRAGFDYNVDKQLLWGGYPRIYQENLDPTRTYRDYYHTYIQRDVREMIAIKNLNLFDKFIKLCAGRIGSIFEVSSLSNEVGVSSPTIQHWLSVLEASYIIFRLQPYYENFGKRAIKSAKIYFTDVGLASYLLDIENTTQLSRDPLRGALFENLVILELVKYRLNQGKDPHLYYYRDTHKNEIDIIVKSAHQLIPIEVKSAQTFSDHFLKGLHYLKKIAGDRVPTGFIIYAGSQEQPLKEFNLINYKNTARIWPIINEPET